MSGLYTRIISGAIFPLHERLKGHSTVQVRKEMEESQWWDLERLNDFRVARLKKLLRNAKVNVPYYEQLFKDFEFNPEDVSSLSDLGRLPFLTKTIIKTQQDKLIAKNAVGLSKFNTGGSSGEPLIFLIGKERVSHDVAAKWRATRWWGVDIGDPEIVVWGSPIELGVQDRMRNIRDKLLRTELLPAFEMSDDKLNGFLEEICSFRPKMLFGYPSAISHIACHAENIGKEMNKLGIKVVFVTSERLYDDQRKNIERVFGCRVANGYGGRDAGFIAHECPEGKMHITAEDIIVEIVDKQGNVLPAGESGEIVVTHLATKDFPFIRYQTGDVGVLGQEKCSCGRGLPVLKEIQGRTTDFIVAKNGTVLHGLALIYILREIQELTSFKIIQESLEKTRVQVVCENTLSNEIKEKIVNGFKQRLGNEVSIEIEEVEIIKPEKSGKYRYVVSHVDHASSI